MRSTTRRLVTGAFAAAGLMVASAAAQAGDVKIGIELGFTGPIESITPGMAASAEMAFKEVNDSGNFLNGDTIVPVRADSTCTDSAAATAAATRLVTSDNVAAIMGDDCSGVTIATLNNVAIPNGVVMISPSATSPALSTIPDQGLFFRTSPSDARQGQVLSDVLMEHGIKKVAVTYTNNDYGKGLADSFADAFKKAGGTITISAPHEDGKGDYSAEVAALQAAGGDLLCVFGYVDQGGKGIIQSALDTGAFSKFALGDGMYGQSLLDAFGSQLDGTIGTHPSSQGEGHDAFAKIAEANNISPTASYVGESYDAAALIALAMQASGSADRAGIKDHVMEVANGPGEKILPGELGKALKILKDGGKVDYVGATNVNLIGPGEAAGTYEEYVVKDGKFTTVKYH